MYVLGLRTIRIITFEYFERQTDYATHFMCMSMARGGKEPSSVAFHHIAERKDREGFSPVTYGLVTPNGRLQGDDDGIMVKGCTQTLVWSLPLQINHQSSNSSNNVRTTYGTRYTIYIIYNVHRSTYSQPIHHTRTFVYIIKLPCGHSYSTSSFNSKRIINKYK